MKIGGSLIFAEEIDSGNMHIASNVSFHCQFNVHMVSKV